MHKNFLLLGMIFLGIVGSFSVGKRLYFKHIQKASLIPTSLQHLAIIMDGNRRWAKKNKMNVLLGHSKGGVDAAKMAIEFCLENKIPYLSLYTFSLENFKRSEDEKECLFNLISACGESELKEFIDRGVRIRFIGDRNLFPQKVRNGCAVLEERTKHLNTLCLNILFCYGGRQEIIAAARSLANDVCSGVLAEGAITEKEFAKRLWLGDCPDPDLVIRTSGVQRLSNFLLYQVAYSEIYFIPCYWPEMTKEKLAQAIAWFNDVKRNFGS